jgi:hypothetical protein
MDFASIKKPVFTENPVSELCARMLDGWCKEATKDIDALPGKESLLVYGTGYNSWGVQTLQKAIGAFAVAGTYLNNREYILRALGMLRFNLYSHLTGEGRCTDGTKWGHTWISTLGISRMIHGVLCLWDYMTDEDKHAFRKMMLSEAEYLLDYEIKAGKLAQSLKNMPESNIWNGAHLLTAAYMFAEGEEKQRIQDKACDFFVNGISTDGDSEDKRVFLGKTVGERYIGSNFFDSFALNHHGYMNVGYMVICLSNIAMVHFFLKALGIPIPEFVYFNGYKLWNLVKHLLFPDGRLNRIGGDTRVRYCYCQDYLVPVLLLVCDLEKDPSAKKLLWNWLLQVKKEFDYNGDGCFLSDRASELKVSSPLYFTRLESDRAAVLSMALKEASVLDSIEDIQDVLQEPFSWHDSYHGSTIVKGKENVASFTWIAGERPQGCFLPKDASGMAEWKENLCGEISGLGLRNFREVIDHQTSLFDNGFATFGCSDVITKDLQEGSPPMETVAKVRNLFIALPDGRTCVTVQLAPSNLKRYVRSVKGTLLRIPNDIFNENVRLCETSKGRFMLRREQGLSDRVMETNSPYINIDGKLSLIAMEGDVRIFRPRKRQIGIFNSLYKDGFLYCEEFCTRIEQGVRVYNDGEWILDDGAVVLSGVNRDQTEEYLRKYPPVYERVEKTVRRATVYDTIGKKYVLTVGLSEAVIEGEFMTKDGVQNRLELKLYV